MKESICAACGGKGCNSCRGFGVALSVGGAWVVWGRRIDAEALRAWQSERIARAVSSIVLLIAAVAGFAAGGWLYWKEGNGATPWEVAKAFRGDDRLTAFAFAALIALFLIYRFSRIGQVGRNIPRKTYGGRGSRENVELTALVTSNATFVDASASYSESAMHAVEEAWKLAVRFRDPELRPLHVLATLLPLPRIAALRARLAFDGTKLLAQLRAMLGVTGGHDHEPPMPMMEFRRAALKAYERAYDRRASSVDPVDLFVALVLSAPPVRDLFDIVGISGEAVENVAVWLMLEDGLRARFRVNRKRSRLKPKGSMNRALTATATPLLDRLATDLTHIARSGMLEPCVGRDAELDGLIRIVESGTGALIVGAPGVGKTALIDGIAQRMAVEDVPKQLEDKRLVSLSIAGVLSSTIGRSPEELLNALLTEAARAGNVVLYIDNVQNLIGVTSSGGATFDLAAVLAAAMRGGGLTVIATTTPTDFRRYLEQSELAGSFTTLSVDEADDASALHMLMARVPMIEYQQRVFFSYEALRKTIELAKRYVHDRPMPEKAFRLLERAAVAAHASGAHGSLITGEDIAAIVSAQTHVDVTAVTEKEGERLLRLEDEIHRRIVGQDDAVTAVSSALRRARVELRDAKRPIASFLFVGPTGVGKTELAKTVASVYFGAEDAMIRLDMTEYQDASAVMRLLGAPVASGASVGVLTDAIRTKPYTLLLLDEFEKAHTEVLDLFLQVMEDGRLTDSAGRTVDCTNLIFIATSNAATAFIQDGIAAGRTLADIRAALMNEELRKHFKPELMNRFDQVVLFRPLTKSEVVAIAKLELAKVGRQLAQKGIRFEASEAAVRELADKGFDPLYGARPLRRTIQNDVEDALAEYLLTGKLGRRDRVVLEAGGGLRIEELPLAK